MFVFVPCDKNIIHCLKILCIVREMQSGTEFWILLFHLRIVQIENNQFQRNIEMNAFLIKLRKLPL